MPFGNRHVCGRTGASHTVRGLNWGNKKAQMFYLEGTLEERGLKWGDGRTKTSYLESKHVVEQARGALEERGLKRGM